MVVPWVFNPFYHVEKKNHVNVHIEGWQDSIKKYIKCSVEGLSKSSLHQALICKFLAAFGASHGCAWTW